MRRDFADVLASSGFDCSQEYRNLYSFMWDANVDTGFSFESVWDIVDDIFSPEFFGDTSVSLRDFDERYGFEFPEPEMVIELDILVALCEYIVNLLERSISTGKVPAFLTCEFNDEVLLIERIMDRAAYRRAEKNGLTIFVPRDLAADAAAEFLPDPISWQQLAYGHRSLKGDVEGKRALLLQLGHELEGRRSDLKAVNSRLEKRMFACLNRLDIRHDNRSEEAGGYNQSLNDMNDSEIESLYDDVYRMLLIAFLELDSEDSFKRTASVAGVKG